MAGPHLIHAAERLGEGAAVHRDESASAMQVTVYASVDMEDS